MTNLDNFITTLGNPTFDPRNCILRDDFSLVPRIRPNIIKRVFFVLAKRPNKTSQVTVEEGIAMLRLLETRISILKDPSFPQDRLLILLQRALPDEIITPFSDFAMKVIASL